MAKKAKKSKITKKAAKMVKKSNAQVDELKVYSDSHQSFIAASFLPRPSRY